MTRLTRRMALPMLAAAALAMTVLAAGETVLAQASHQVYGLSGRIETPGFNQQGYTGTVKVSCEVDPSQSLTGTFPLPGDRGYGQQIICNGAVKVEGSVSHGSDSTACTPFRFANPAKGGGVNYAYFHSVKVDGGNVACVMTAN